MGYERKVGLVIGGLLLETPTYTYVVAEPVRRDATHALRGGCQ